MAHQIIQVLVLLLLPQMTYGEERTCSSTPYSQKGFQLQGHTVKKLSATSRSACMRECKLHNKCYSINYHHGKNICELNDANHLTNPESLTFVQGYEYNNNHARSPLRCSTKYCSRKTDKCVIDRNGRDYKCLSCKEILTFPQPSVQNKVALEYWFTESLNAFTVCSWTQPVTKTKNSVFSYATESNSNEIFVHISESSATSKMYVRLMLSATSTDGKAEYPIDGGWHHSCITWENTLGKWEIFIDGIKQSEGNKNAGRVMSKGVVVLGQDQDRLNGGFSLEQSYQGNLTNVNLWNRVLTAQEVLDLSRSCSNGEGNVIKWSDFLDKEEGDIQQVCSDACQGT